MNIKHLAVIAAITSFNLQAGAIIKRTVCPALTDDVQAIVNSIQSLRDELNQLPECTSIDEKLKNVNDIVANEKWSDVKEMFKSSDAPALEGEDVEQLSGLVQSASKNLSELIGMISGKNTCLDKNKKTSFLSKMSGVVREVSGIVGNVTGPYGMAVNLGGNLLSSAITGIDEVLSSKAYKFKDPEQELLFMNQFCSFSEIQKDINDYLNLEERNNDLRELGSYLKVKITDIRDNCPECKAYKVAWNTREESNKVIKRIEADAHIIGYGSDMNMKDYTRCKEMHRAIHTDNSDFKQFIKILDEYENPLSSQSDKDLIEEVVTTTNGLGEIYPPFHDCVKLKPVEKVSLSRDFNNLMRDEILPLNTQIFTQQMGAFQYLANRKFKSTLGDYMQLSLDRQKWIKKETGIVGKKVNDPNYKSSTEKVRQTKRELEERFRDELLPDYLKFMAKRNLKEVESFSKEFKKFEKKIIKHYRKLYGKKVKDLLSLEGLFVSEGFDNRVYLAEKHRVMGMLNLALDQTRTFTRYCDFTNYMLNGTPKIEMICVKNTEKLKADYKKLSEVSSSFAEIIKESNCFKKSKDHLVQKSRVVDHSNHIREWNSRGEERWCLKSDTREICK